MSKKDFNKIELNQLHTWGHLSQLLVELYNKPKVLLLGLIKNSNVFKYIPMNPNDNIIISPPSEGFSVLIKTNDYKSLVDAIYMDNSILIENNDLLIFDKPQYFKDNDLVLCLIENRFELRNIKITSNVLILQLKDDSVEHVILDINDTEKNSEIIWGIFNHKLYFKGSLDK